MGYDLLIADRHGCEIRTFPFLWLAKLAAKVCAPTGGYASITRGRHDIIWRYEPGSSTL